MPVALIAFAIGTKHEELKLRDAITAVEGDVLAIEHRLERPSPVAAVLSRRLDHLEKRLDYPRFTRHAKGCAQCRGDVPNAEEGGPSPLCARGFAILKEDAAAWNEETP